MNTRILNTVSPERLFRIFAFAEMVTWAGLITALLLRFLNVSDAWVTPAGGTHGFIFLCYCITTVFVWVNQRWTAAEGILGLVTAIIPFATVPFELRQKRRGRLTGDWRLRPGGDQPQGFIEYVQAWILKNLVFAIVLGVLVVTGVFVALLALGSPIPTS